jgi:hypothetical protein
MWTKKTGAAHIGHASTQIVPRYAQVLDQNRFDAMKKLETLRQSSISNGTASEVVQPTSLEMKPIARRKSQ